MEQNFIGSIIKSYRFVWFRGVRGRRTEEWLERMMEKYPAASDAIPNLCAFKGGYGMLVLRSYIPTLRRIMRRMFRGSVIDLIYPSSDRNFDSNYWCYPSANALYSAWFSELDQASEIAAAFKEYCSMVTAGANSTSLDSQASYDIRIVGGRTHSFLVGEDSILHGNFFPDDETERERQDMLNIIWLHFDDAPFLAPITLDEADVLDIGCGSGAWAFQVAENYQRWHVEGYDVSRIIPDHQPPNCYLYLDDCNIPRSERNRFDLIHVRGMSVCVDDWPSLIFQCYRALKPGGYLEIKDVILIPRRYPGSIATPACNRLWRLIEKGTRQHDRDFLAINKIYGLMLEQGFHGMSQVTKEWSLHAQDRDSAGLADSVRTSSIDGVKVLLHSLVSCSPEQKEMHLMEFRREISVSRTFVQATTIYGRKPGRLCN